MDRRGLVLEQRAYHLGRALSAAEHFPAWQVERRIFRMVAGQIPQAVFAQAIDHAADAGPVDRAGAHRAGFGGRVERGIAQGVGIDRGAGLRRQQPLGMRRAVMGGHIAVLGLDQYLMARINENGAEGMVAVGHGTARDLERPPQEMRVAL